MSADIAARLRQLSQDYHEGRLDRAAYRSLRGPLLDSLIENIVVPSALDATQPRAVATGTVRALPEPMPDNRLTGKSLGAVAMVLAVAVVMTGGLLMLRGRPTSPTSVGAQAPERARGQVLELVSPFMDRGEWTDARLASLNASLLEVGGAQIAEVAHDDRFQRFVDELRSHLKEQQALSAAPLTADNSPLAALAVTVGIDLNSPDSALHITALPPTPPSDSAPTEAPARIAARHAAVDATAQTPPAPGAGAVQRANGGAGADGASNIPTFPGAAVDGAAGMQTPVRAAVDGAAGMQTPVRAAVDGAAGMHTPVRAPTDGAAGIPKHPRAAPADPSGLQTSTRATSTATPSSDTTAVVESHEGACRLDLIRSRRPLCHDVLPDGSEAPVLALIPAGAFDMGGTASSEEQPIHHVTIPQPFAVGVYEVSQGEFKQYCDHAKRSCAPQPWTGDDYPVVNVSWDDARAYTDWLSATTHHHYSLPTEAQWEYAARAGRTGLFPSGDALSATDAQFSGAARQTAAARRSQTFNPNAFRLLHSVGNVREWVEDSWVPNFAGAPNDGSAVNSAQSTLRVVRGGSYADSAARLRLSLRESLPLTTRDVTTGFRIVRELP